MPEGAPDPPVVERAELLGQLLDVSLSGGPRQKIFRLRILNLSRPGPPAGSGLDSLRRRIASPTRKS